MVNEGEGTWSAQRESTCSLVSARKSSAPIPRKKRVQTYDGFVENVLVDRLLGEPRRGDDDDFERVEVKMPYHSSVDLSVEP